MPKYFDIHSHLQDSQYESDRGEVTARLKETNTHTIVVGVDLESSIKAVNLAEKHDEIYASIGVHPVDNQYQVFDKEKFGELVKHSKVVAIGECGFDFFHAEKESDYERQRRLFVDQINFAATHEKPLMIHARKAYDEVLTILEPLKESIGDRLRGNVHFFTGSLEEAERFFALDFSISFTGVITFARDYDKVIKSAPLNRIMVETDAPYVSPTPHRGQRNEPIFVKEVVRRIAEIRGEGEESVREALVNNALSMIG